MNRNPAHRNLMVSMSARWMGAVENTRRSVQCGSVSKILIEIDMSNCLAVSVMASSNPLELRLSQKSNIE